MNTAHELLAAVEAVFPCPSAEVDAYAAAYWHQEMESLLIAAAEQISVRYQEILQMIETECLVSGVFTVCTPAVPVRSVDAPALCAALPAVYESLVRIRATDAERFIGRRKLYELACGAAGLTRVRPAEYVNLGDLVCELPADEAAMFIRVSYKPGKTVVVRIPEDGK